MPNARYTPEMPFGPSSEQLPEFKTLFMNREEELREWRRLLAASVGEPLPIQLFTGVPGSGKTFLHRYFGELCRTAGVSFLSFELDPSRGGEPRTDRAAVALRLAAELDMPAPSLQLVALVLAMQEAHAAAFAFDVADQPEAAKGILAWLFQFSFVQPVVGGFSIHPVMRRALVGTSDSKDTIRRHGEWRDYWSGRSTSPLDAAEQRWWLHRYALDPVEAWTAWSEEAESARRTLRSIEHRALVEVAREWLWDPPIGSPKVSQEDRAVFLCAWADEAQQQAIGDQVESLHEAVAVYRIALGEFAVDALRAEWGTAQNSLGNALQKLGRLTGEERFLHEAVAAYRLARESCPRVRHPEEWSMAQHNLGNILVTLGERTGEERFLREAVSALRAALEVHTRDDLPAAWAGSQGSLGIALQTLGQVTGEEDHLHEALEAYRSALAVYTRDGLPGEWARIQNGLGNALDSLGQQTGQESYLLEAVEAYRSALDVHTREALPLDWAGTLCNLGIALVALGHFTGRDDYLREAVDAHREALEVYNRDTLPVGWAGTQNNLGLALRALGELRAEAALLHEAVVAHRLALDVYTREAMPTLWAQVQGNLAQASASLALVSEIPSWPRTHWPARSRSNGSSTNRTPMDRLAPPHIWCSDACRCAAKLARTCLRSSTRTNERRGEPSSGSSSARASRKRACP